MKKPVLWVLALLLAPGAAFAANADCPTPSITIKSEELSADEDSDFEQALRAAIAKVCRWWGPTFTGAFTVNIEDSRGPSMALVPGWRGNRGTMLFRSGTTRASRSAVTHEVVHVFAPNGNRFLAEGFAVYAHEHLEGRDTYPAFGTELHEAAKDYAAAVDLSALDELATPQRLRLGDLEERRAYIVAGSFIKFLIATHGMEKFRRLYAMTPMESYARDAGAPERWKAVYGKDLKALEVDWKAMVAAR